MTVHERRIGGIGGIGLAVAMIVGFALGDPPGGDYSADDVAAFVGEDHRTVAILSLYMILLSVLSLLALGAYLRGAAFASSGAARSFWGATIASAASFLAGWLIVLTPATSRSLGGGPEIDPALAYTFVQAGFWVMLVGGGTLLGIALLVLAVGGSAGPTWLRVLAGLAGLLGLGSPAFFPFFALLLFALVIGIWLLVSRFETPASASSG